MLLFFFDLRMREFDVLVCCCFFRIRTSKQKSLVLSNQFSFDFDKEKIVNLILVSFLFLVQHS